MHLELTATRFPVPVATALKTAGWQPGRWNIKQAEYWADTLRAHRSPGGHQHAISPAAVEAWAEFGALRITATKPGRTVAPTPLHIDPLHGLHMARTLNDLGRALDTDLSPLGQETAADHPGEHQALLAIDSTGRIYSLDHSGDWYLGPSLDHALVTLLTGTEPQRLLTPSRQTTP